MGAQGQPCRFYITNAPYHLVREPISFVRFQIREFDWPLRPFISLVCQMEAIESVNTIQYSCILLTHVFMYIVVHTSIFLSP